MVAVQGLCERLQVTPLALVIIRLLLALGVRLKPPLDQETQVATLWP